MNFVARRAARKHEAAAAPETNFVEVKAFVKFRKTELFIETSSIKAEENADNSLSHGTLGKLHLPFSRERNQSINNQLLINN